MQEPSNSIGNTWRRKTADEAKRDRRRHRDRLHARNEALAGAIAAVTGAAWGAIEIHSSGRLNGWFGIEFFCMTLFGSLGLFLAILVQTFIELVRPQNPRVGICNRCFKVTIDGRADTCACGGTFEDSDGWTLNRCPKCDYDLRGSTGTCPECGTQLPRIPQQDTN